MITSNSSMPVEYAVPWRSTAVTEGQLDVTLLDKLRCASLGAVIYGPTGTGKTTAMVIARRLTLGQRSLWVDWPELVGPDRESFAAMRGSDKDKFDPTAFVFRFAGALFVDDVGAKRAVESGYKTGEEESLFDAFVNRRTALPLPLWITTNLSQAEMRTRYGERAVSRLVEHCLWLPMAGDDRRLA